MRHIISSGNLQIYTIQEFIEAIGESDGLWQHLVGREVIHKNGIKGVISLVNNHRIFLENFSLAKSYSKSKFIEEFQEVSPSIHTDELLDPHTQEEILFLEEKLEDLFENNFLMAKNFYNFNCSDYIPPFWFEQQRTTFVKRWTSKNLEFELDDEQSKAVATVEENVQVVARAGSGKTRTLISRALFLQKHCGVQPHEILLLAFNRKAVSEINDRLTKQTEGSIPHVMTFHALAYALVHPEESLLFDEPDGTQSKSRALQTVIDSYLHSPQYIDKIRSLMMAYFREDWERIVTGGYDKSPEEMVEYRRSLQRETLRGEYVKSFGEKIIADFLFEHDINYKYEHSFFWDDINYRPDFTIFTGKNQGVVIEYFGLKGDPDYDEMSERKRQFWREKDGWELLEFYPSDLAKNGNEEFYFLLKKSLEQYQISCNPLSEEEIWNRIKNRAVDRFTTSMRNFIERCRKLIISLEELAYSRITHECINEVEERFLDLAEIFYQAYLERLQVTGEEDFDGLMQRAEDVIISGNTFFKRKSCSGDLKYLQYILIDEYQDFSLLFYNLIEAIRIQNPGVKLFCVGDDWQAINGFAGSDLLFYEKFESLFQPSRKLAISTNYRSATSIIKVSNQLMNGLGLPAREGNNLEGKVEIADLATFKLSPIEQKNYQEDYFIPAILRLINKSLQENKNVVLLSRKNNLSQLTNYGDKDKKRVNQLNNFLELLRSKLPKQLRNKVNISTTHKYKGLEQEVVIILDAVPHSYPLIHPDFIFTRIFGSSQEKVIEEERRLFYVAITRAVGHLIIVTEKNNVSPFLESLQKSRIKIPFLHWSDYKPVAGELKQITVKVTSQYGKGSTPTFEIRERLGAEGYKWNSSSKTWWRIYSAQNFSVQSFLAATQWISYANGIQLRFCDDLENVLAEYTVDAGCPKCVFDKFSMQCSQYP